MWNLVRILYMYAYDDTQQDSCMQTSFLPQLPQRRLTKTFLLASAAIVHKAPYKYVCIDDTHRGTLRYVTYHFVTRPPKSLLNKQRPGVVVFFVL